MTPAIYNTPEYRIFERNFFSKMMPHQNARLNEMLENDRLTVCMPTGTGKSRVIYGDMLDHLKLPTFDTFAIASHRLLLNVQHFNELFQTLGILASKIGFIFVGSGELDLSELRKDVSVNNILAKFETNYRDLITSCLSTENINYHVNRHHEQGRDVIIITTYHSMDKLKDLDIHTLYCDEAHFLATQRETAQFKDNFEKLTAKRKFFFTATPKDLVNFKVPENEEEDSMDAFLMNNEKIFGKRVGISFKESIDECLIVKPYVHLIEISGFKGSRKYSSTVNYSMVIMEAMKQHEKTLKDVSICAPKLLIKCPSVDAIWKIKEELEKNEDSGIQIFAGASHSPHMNNYFVDKEPINGKTEFLGKLQNLRDGQKAIILHYDILSEGIDVPGITGVMFLSKELPSKPKILQTIGRSTRLLSLDREAVRSGKIAKNDYERMIKPYCTVILPAMSDEMDHSAENIARMVIDLRDNFGFKPEIYTEAGEDVSKTKVEDAMEGLNKKNDKDEKFSKIESVKHYIELLDDQRIEMIEREEISKMHSKRNENVVEYVKEFSKFLKSH